MSKQGLLITFEGPDGAGKTTVLEQVIPWLKKRYGGDILTTREPGGVKISEGIREIILSLDHAAMDQKTELLLYIAARRQHWVEKVLPALSAGKLVVMDRFIDSSIAYQGYGRGLAIADIDWLNQYATDGAVPDLTICFSVAPEIGLSRIAANRDREVNRLDLEKLDLHKRVSEGYQALAKQTDRIRVIDASQSLDAVILAVKRVLETFLEQRDDD